LFIFGLFGLAAILIWQYHSEDARELLRGWTPSLVWRLFPSSESSADVVGPLAAPEEVSAHTPADPQSAAVPAPPLETSPGSTHQLVEVVARDISTVQQKLAQVAAKQQELAAEQARMANDVATLRAAEQDLRQKLFKSTARPVPLPPRRQNPHPEPVRPAAQASSERSAPEEAAPVQRAGELNGAVPRPPMPLTGGSAPLDSIR
jgi:hypothetical protein